MDKIRLFKVLMSPDAKRRVGETLDSLYVGEGPRVKEFEGELQKVLGSRQRPLATSSCTGAIELSLKLIGVGPEAEIITPAMACTASTAAIVNQRARPVWADVDALTGVISPEDVAKKITPRTRAILAIDWAGRRCDYEALRAHARGIPIIEDAAHAFLMPRTGGDFVCYSFGPIKHLTCGGGGGALVINRESDLQRRAKLLRWYGLDRDNGASFRCGQNIQESGLRWHMTDVEASIGLANLPLAIEAVKKHRENAKWYNDNLPADDEFILPPLDKECSWWLYTVLVPGARDQFINFLDERGIEASPVHNRNDLHAAYNYPNGPLPGTDVFASSEAAIPCGSWLSNEDRDRVRSVIEAWVTRNA